MFHISAGELPATDPLELAQKLRGEIGMAFSGYLGNKEDIASASALLTKAASYMCYFIEMESVARNVKRQKRRTGCTKEEFDNILGCEEVFAAYRRIAETYYGQISKQMTLKRLELDEYKYATKIG